jgi:hypothetical protein
MARNPELNTAAAAPPRAGCTRSAGPRAAWARGWPGPDVGEPRLVALGEELAVLVNDSRSNVRPRPHRGEPGRTYRCRRDGASSRWPPRRGARGIQGGDPRQIESRWWARRSATTTIATPSRTRRATRPRPWVQVLAHGGAPVRVRRGPSRGACNRAPPLRAYGDAREPQPRRARPPFLVGVDYPWRVCTQRKLVLDLASAGTLRRECLETPGVLWGCDTNHSTPGDPFR